MSQRRTFLFLALTSLALFAGTAGILQWAGVGDFLRDQPPPTRTELRSLWESYPEGEAWQDEEYAKHYYIELGLDLRFTLGEQLAWPARAENLTLDGGELWPHYRELDLAGRLELDAANHLQALQKYEPPAELPRWGHLRVEDLLGLLTSWEIAEEDQPVLREALTHILDTRLDYPEWPGFFPGFTDVLYASAWLEELGVPLDAARRERIRAHLSEELASGIRGQTFRGPWNGGASPAVHGIALMGRVGVPEKADLDALWKELQVYWGGKKEVEFWSLEAGEALLLLQELRAESAPPNR